MMELLSSGLPADAVRPFLSTWQSRGRLVQAKTIWVGSPHAEKEEFQFNQLSNEISIQMQRLASQPCRFLWTVLSGVSPPWFNVDGKVWPHRVIETETVCRWAIDPQVSKRRGIAPVLWWKISGSWRFQLVAGWSQMYHLRFSFRLKPLQKITSYVALAGLAWTSGCSLTSPRSDVVELSKFLGSVHLICAHKYLLRLP